LWSISWIPSVSESSVAIVSDDLHYDQREILKFPTILINYFVEVIRIEIWSSIHLLLDVYTKFLQLK
jgi:hypothetical protein